MDSRCCFDCDAARGRIQSRCVSPGVGLTPTQMFPSARLRKQTTPPVIASRYDLRRPRKNSKRIQVIPQLFTVQERKRRPSLSFNECPRTHHAAEPRPRRPNANAERVDVLRGFELSRQHSRLRFLDVVLLGGLDGVYWARSVEKRSPVSETLCTVSSHFRPARKTFGPRVGIGRGYRNLRTPICLKVV